MQARILNHQSCELPQFASEVISYPLEINSVHNREESHHPAMHFQSTFMGSMEMYQGIQTVADYLEAHQEWFADCAQPMQVEPLGNNAYILTIGHFSALGYEVEPKIAVVLVPPEQHCYRTHTVPVPDYTPPGYEVDYQAVMQLKAISPEWTKVEWTLHLGVMMEFPNFIYKLPLSFVQNTGDRVLNQIVRQISRRLNYKVQANFHTRLGLPIPSKKTRTFKIA